MGRLDNIIARNRRPSGLQERVIVSTVFGLIVLLVIALAVFTDLGLPPEARETRDAPAASPPDPSHRVDGIHLWKQPVKPAAASPAQR